MNRDFQRKQREFREDLNQRRNEELAQVVEQANRVIRQIAEQEKYDIIFQDAVYANPRIDITDKVIKALEDKPPAQARHAREPLSLGEIAARLGGRVVGDAGIRSSRSGTLEHAGPPPDRLPRQPALPRAAGGDARGRRDRRPAG